MNTELLYQKLGGPGFVTISVNRRPRLSKNQQLTGAKSPKSAPSGPETVEVGLTAGGGGRCLGHFHRRRGSVGGRGRRRHRCPRRLAAAERLQAELGGLFRAD